MNEPQINGAGGFSLKALIITLVAVDVLFLAGAYVFDKDLFSEKMAFLFGEDITETTEEVSKKTIEDKKEVVDEVKKEQEVVEDEEDEEIDESDPLKGFTYPEYAKLRDAMHLTGNVESTKAEKIAFGEERTYATIQMLDDKTPEICSYLKQDESTGFFNVRLAANNLQTIGIEKLDFPYDPSWGSDDYWVKAYDKQDEGVKYPTLSFGPPGCFEGGGVVRPYMVMISDRTQTLQEKMKEYLDRMNNSSFNFGAAAEVYKVGEHDVLHMSDGDGLCGSESLIVNGPQVTYHFQGLCSLDSNEKEMMENMIKSLKFTN